LIRKTLTQARQHESGGGQTLFIIECCEALEPQRQMLGIRQRKEDTNVLDYFLGASTIGGKKRHSGRHSLEQDHTKGLVIGAQRKYIEGFEVAPGFRDVSQEQHLLGNA